MRNWLVLLLLIPILLVLNGAVLRNEAILKDGETILLELAPVDPRSLMQGDYMRLRFALAGEARRQAEESNLLDTLPRQGHLVLSIGDKGKGSFERFHKGESLKETERLLPYRRKGSGAGVITIRPDSFFFQEGLADHFQAAKFGVIRMADGGAYLLTGLADENGNRL